MGLNTGYLNVVENLQHRNKCVGSILFARMNTQEKYLSPGCLTSRGQIVEETAKEFVVVPRPFSEARIKITIDDLLSRPLQTPQDIAYIHQFPFLKKLISNWKDNDYWVMSRSKYGYPFLLGGGIIDGDPDDAPTAITFARMKNHRGSTSVSATRKNQPLPIPAVFNKITLDEHGLPTLIHVLNKDSPTFRGEFYRANQRFLVPIESFDPLVFCWQTNDLTLVKSRIYAYAGTLIRTIRMQKEELYEAVIEDMYRLLDTRKGVGKTAQIGKAKGVFIQEKHLLKYFGQS